MTQRRRPRSRPPWWPESEQWPPREWNGHGWGGQRRPMWRPFGCFIVLFLVFATGAFTVGVWALAAIVGVVSAPPIVVLGGLVALVVIGAIALVLARIVRGLAGPVDDLVDAAARIEAGDFSVRVPERGAPQLRSLVRAFNGMSARLAEVDTRRRTFLADVAHELRTPLTVIAGQLEAIEDGVYPADAEHLAPIHEQIRAMEKLIDDLRTVALAEAGSLSLDRQPTDLGALVDEAVTAFVNLPATGAVQVASEVEPDLPSLNLDASRIRQVMANLLANAVRHTPPYGRVRVVVRRASGSEPANSAVVEVVDTGRGIPADLLPTVFDRFVKDAASAGSGLGLAIARDLVLAHGGTITAESPPGSGTTIRIVLPIDS